MSSGWMGKGHGGGTGHVCVMLVLKNLLKIQRDSGTGYDADEP